VRHQRTFWVADSDPLTPVSPRSTVGKVATRACGELSSVLNWSLEKGTNIETSGLVVSVARAKSIENNRVAARREGEKGCAEILH
jgi:hypothetical protein